MEKLNSRFLTSRMKSGNFQVDDFKEITGYAESGQVFPGDLSKRQSQASQPAFIKLYNQFMKGAHA